MISTIKGNRVRAMCIPVNGIFVWQNTIYQVIGVREDDFLEVRALASGWTHNPDDRYLGTTSQREVERFNGYCYVTEFLFVQEVAKDVLAGAQG